MVYLKIHPRLTRFCLGNPAYLLLANLLEFLPMPMHFSRWGANLEAAKFRWQFGQTHSGCFFNAGTPDVVEIAWPKTSTGPFESDNSFPASELSQYSVNWNIPVLTDLKETIIRFIACLKLAFNALDSCEYKVS